MTGHTQGIRVGIWQQEISKEKELSYHLALYRQVIKGIGSGGRFAALSSHMN